MIHIDFQGGAHGTFLEFVCNKIAGVAKPGKLPFNSFGASHNRSYISKQVFFSGHYSYLSDDRIKKFSKIISIQIEHDDLLPLSQISLLRAGDYGYDNDQLEVDTFNKLNNANYRWVLDKLIDGFFTNQVRDSYNAVKDPSWPNINCLDDFLQLPDHIRTECIQQHRLVLIEISEKNPNCPRSVLREFFKIGFQHPSQHGFMTQQKKAIYSPEQDVYVFPFSCFYDKEQFQHEIKQISDWAGIQYDCESEVSEIHDIFLSKQPYKHSKHKCDQLVQDITQGKQLNAIAVNMLEEAYINAALGQDYFQ